MKPFMQKYTRYMVWVICASVVLGVALLGAIAGKHASVADKFNIDNYNLDFTTFIYYADSETGQWHEYDKLYDDENRIWVSIDKIPENLKNAFIAIEDERFYKHHGVDIKRTSGAAIKYIGNFFKKTDSTYGGSTITQQLVKNLTKDEDFSAMRKIREIFRAVSLEDKLSKDEILEIYLNTIYLSRQCNGVQSAAEFYFDKDVSELTLAEAASIAGITQYPSLYDPISNPDKNKEKQELVLYKMYELEYIGEEEYKQALAEELVFAGAEGKRVSGNSYFVDAIIEEVASDLENELGMQKQLALKMLYTGGLKIYSTLDIDVQNAMDEVYKDPKSFPSYGGDVQPESAMVVLDPYTGGIAGMVGGRGEKEGRRTLNRAMHTLRQPGSTIKPISVYAPSIEYGLITPYSIVYDTPLTIGSWSPKNADNKFRGPITISEAVASSINTAAVKTIDLLSVDASYNYLENNFGITSLVNSRKDGELTLSDKDYAPLSLGGLTDGVSVLEMATAYTAFANNGICSEPHTYIRVLDQNNNILLDKQPKTYAAISPKTAHTMTNMLRSVVTGGTGSGAALSGIPVAGKTGTTSDDYDRWFIGYTPYYLGAVWFGYDTPTTLRSVGYNPSVSVWRAVMSRVHKNLEYRSFRTSAPSEVAYICEDSGKTATSLCIKAIGGSRVSAVSSDTGEYSTASSCKMHKQFKICTRTGLLAGENCPSGTVITVGALGISDSGKDGYIPSKKCTHKNIELRLKTSNEYEEEDEDEEGTEGEENPTGEPSQGEGSDAPASPAPGEGAAASPSPLPDAGAQQI